MHTPPDHQVKDNNIHSDFWVQETDAAFSFFRCARTAIEGGLSPEKAHCPGESYLQSLLDLSRVSDLQTLNHIMYENFIQRVHKCPMIPALSPQVQSCRDYIELPLEDELSLKVLAERAGYTGYYLSRKHPSTI